MVNLAFVISLVASAVVLIVSITIFSDVVEAMEATLPVSVAGSSPSIDNNWYGTNWDREGSLTCNTYQTGADGDVNVQSDHISATNNRVSGGGCVFNMFKTFEASEVEGKLLTVDNERINSLSSVFSRIEIFDGSYNLTDFGVNNGLVDLKGNGVLQTCLTSTTIAFARTNTTCTIDTSSSSTSFVTIVMTLEDANNTLLENIINYNIYGITIEDIGTWDITNLGSPSTDTDIFISTDDGQTFGSAGETMLISEEGLIVPDDFTLDPNATSPSTPLSSSEQQQVDTFNNARAIGFTVIGIMPIALFFALFTILDPRMSGIG